VLADAGFASGAAVKTLQDRTIAPLVAIAKIQPHQPYDFRPPPDPKPERQITEPRPIAMKAKLETTMPKRATNAENKPWSPSSASSKGIVKRAMGFRSFLRRGLDKVKTEWTLASLAYHRRRMAALRPACCAAGFAAQRHPEWRQTDRLLVSGSSLWGQS
jgi:hypothetical protein